MANVSNPAAIERELIRRRARVARLIAESDQRYAEAERSKKPADAARKRAASQHLLGEAREELDRMKQLVRRL